MKRINSFIWETLIISVVCLTVLIGEMMNNAFAGLGDFFKEVLQDVNKKQDDKKEGEYNTVPFYKTVEIEFQKDLLDKSIKTSAIFKRIENVPKSGPGVVGYINLRLCDPKQKTICDDLFLINKAQFDKVYELNEDEKIDIYGTIKPKRDFFGGHFYILKFERITDSSAK